MYQIANQSRWLSKEDYRKLIKTIKSYKGTQHDVTKYRDRDLMITRFLYYTGVRLRNLVSVNLKNLDLKKRTYLILKENSKGKIPIEIPLPKPLVKYLRSFIHKNRKSFRSGFIFFSRRHKRKDGIKALHVSENGFDLRWRKYRKLADLGEIYGHTTDGRKLHKITIHSARHRFITSLIRNKVPLALVKEIAGHNYLSSTIRYYHPLIEDKIKAVDGLKF